MMNKQGPHYHPEWFTPTFTHPRITVAYTESIYGQPIHYVAIDGKQCHGEDWSNESARGHVNALNEWLTMGDDT